MRRTHRGFTLIELLVVIAIIGILATIVLVSLGTARRRARDARRIGDVRQVTLALQLYHEENGKYPADIYAATGSLTPTYMRSVPKDPNASANYLYGVDSATNPQDYVMGATLEVANQALNDDVDTNPVYGINCADLTYCVQPL